MSERVDLDRIQALEHSLAEANRTIAQALRARQEASANYVAEPRPALVFAPRCEVCGALMVPVDSSTWKCLSCGSMSGQAKEKE